MSGATGAFDAATLAMASLKAAGERVVGVFVATRLNLPQWRRTAELAVALGIDGMMFNRFNPGGRGRENVALLQASPREIAEALDVAQEVSEEYGLPISCSIALPPCLIDTSRHARLSFGFCSAGTFNSYYTLDPLGNVRPCNHSPTILGNLRGSSYLDVVRNGRLKAFCDARPAFCAGCKFERTCQGGCKAAAEACSGSPSDEDPFLRAFREQARKP
jgi:radical SAM protein with 4Fe4S-binding SPASM domain